MSCAPRVGAVGRERRGRGELDDVDLDRAVVRAQAADEPAVGGEDRQDGVLVAPEVLDAREGDAGDEDQRDWFGCGQRSVTYSSVAMRSTRLWKRSPILPPRIANTSVTSTAAAPAMAPPVLSVLSPTARRGRFRRW
jgi:hypothetical protein